MANNTDWKITEFEKLKNGRHVLRRSSGDILILLVLTHHRTAAHTPLFGQAFGTFGVTVKLEKP